MSVGSIREPEHVGARRGEVVVCINVHDGGEAATVSLRNLLEHTPTHVRVIICSALVSGQRLRQLIGHVEDPASGRIPFLVGNENAGAGGGVVTAIASAAPADVVVITSDCDVANGWLDGLGTAAYHDAAVATARPLIRAEGSSADLVNDDRPLEEAARLVRDASLRITPRVGAAHGPCLYVRRSAIELIGGTEGQAVPGEPAFSQRCLQAGLLHVLADDVLVQDHREPGSVPSPDGSPSTAVARSVSVARVALDRLSLVLDARALGGPMDGTRVQVLELLAAVARTGDVRMTVIVPAGLDARTADLLRGLPDVSLINADAACVASTIRGDVVHRPFQISAPADLTFLARLADRIVITHQDLLSYQNPSYFRSPAAWAGYRDLTRRALGAADGVAFVSAHARDAAIAEELVESHRAMVVHNGVDHSISIDDSRAAPRQAGVLATSPELPMMLCLGTDFRHKNRIFALRIVHELQRRHGWRGRLVMAGPRVGVGSSWADEQELLGAHPSLAEATLHLGPVSEAEKNWLLERASLVVYPTVHEGFGLVPFEAANHGVPCLWAPGTSLSEVLPDASAGIVAWDAQISAARALELMNDASARAENLRAVRGAAESLPWDMTARRMIEVYRTVLAQPATPVSALERMGGLMQGGLSEDAMRLVGPDGALSPELERPLLALATHRKLGGPVLGAIKAGYRVLKWPRRGRSPGR